MDGSVSLRQTFFQPVYRFGDDFLYKFHFLGYLVAVPLNSRNGKKILHHVKKPDRVFVDCGDQF